MTRVLVSGACGRMGRAVLQAVLEDEALDLVGAVDLTAGMDVGELIGKKATGILVEQDLKVALERLKPEVMVDFTRPDSVFANAVMALERGVSPVIGTTGLSDGEKETLQDLAVEYAAPCFIAPNFAIGAVLMMMMSTQAAQYLPDVEIIEMHHDKKLDAPSGTALLTAELLSEVRTAHKQGHPEEKEKISGARGAETKDGIRIHSVRLPGYVAHQEVIFGGLGETLSIRHDSLNRESFMPGVVLACKKVRSLTGLTIGLEHLMS